MTNDSSTHTSSTYTSSTSINALWYKAGAILVVVALAFAFKMLIQPDNSLETIVFSGETMSTSYHIKVVRRSHDATMNNIMASGIQSRLEAVNQQMSTYYEGGDIYRLNQAEAGVAVKVAPEVILVLQQAQKISRMTNGAFDVTVGPLVRIWGFHDKISRKQAPTDMEISEAQQKVGYTHLVIDAKANTVTKAVPGLEVDLSAIAKGYAVDQVALFLEEQGEKNYMVEVGGEIRCRGVNDQSIAWKIGIEKPADSPASGRRISKVVSLGHVALATSGDYRSFYMLDGQRISHTINPQTGRPISHQLASVSVLTKDCMTADALATAFTVIGMKNGLQLADKYRIAAYFIERSGTAFVERASKRFQEKFDSGRNN